MLFHKSKLAALVYLGSSLISYAAKNLLASIFKVFVKLPKSLQCITTLVVCQIEEANRKKWEEIE